MPEYSTPKLTPSGTSKLTGMNSNNPGYFEIGEILDIIRSTYGQANGVATLDANQKLTLSQLPELADDVIVVASYSSLDPTGVAGKIYITADNNKMYRWDPNLATPDYVELSVDLSAYATKVELAAEESARESADTNLKNALQATNKRVTNLEQKAGDEIVVDYPSSTYGMDGVPANVAEYAKVTKLRGVTRAENQLIDHTVGSGNGVYVADGSMTYSDGAFHVTSGNAYTRFGFVNQTFLAGHKYLFAFSAKKTSGDGVIKYHNGTGWTGDTVLTTSWQTLTWVWDVSTTFTMTNGDYPFWCASSGGTLLADAKVLCRDLTLYFGSSVPTLAEIQQYYPWLLEPSEYGTSLVDSVYEGVKSIGRNLIDWSAITADAFVCSADGEVQSYGSGDVNATDYIPVVGGSSYFLGGFTSINYGNSGAVYDINKNFIVAINHYNDLQPITIPANGAYVRLSLWLANFSDAENSAYFTLNSNPHAFTPYMTDTLSLPTPITLRSAGTVAEEFDLETGEKTNPIGSYTFTGNETWNTYENCKYTTVIASSVKWSASANVVGNILCPTLVRNSVNELRLNGATLSGIAIGVDGAIAIGEIDYANIASLTGKTILFELATPDPVTQLTPVLDPFIEVEGGGTIRPIQTQTTQIDSAMSVDYLGV